MGLAMCCLCHSEPCEQTRDQMGAGDYKEIQKQNAKGRWVDDPDYYKTVYLDDHNRKDFRISCTRCDNATPWNKPDAPNMPGVGMDFTRKLWNDSNKT